jgi:hypothetical protein
VAGRGSVPEDAAQERPAEQVFRNIDALRGLPGSAVDPVMQSLPLGMGCDHCHAPDDWTAANRPAHAMVARMLAMFAVFPRYMPESARTQCFMCHKGQRSPARAAPAVSDRTVDETREAAHRS